MIPIIVEFRAANKNLKLSESYSTCDKLLLTQELNTKYAKLIQGTQNLRVIKAYIIYISYWSYPGKRKTTLLRIYNNNRNELLTSLFYLLSFKIILKRLY